VRLRRHTQRRHEESHGIDLAPMLDFVLNLLIFFIITTSFVKEPGVMVTRPTADTVAYRESGNILVAVRDNGDIWMDRRQVELRDVRTLIERLHVERPEDTVVIVADRGARAGMVGQVMDEVHLGGIHDVAIGAAPTSGG
jgi:biopolymer transport protein ExbD